MIVEQVSCNGTERRLRDCAIRDDPDGHCSHYEDAGVQCCKFMCCDFTLIADMHECITAN